jgi:hypothetical protein
LHSVSEPLNLDAVASFRHQDCSDHSHKRPFVASITRWGKPDPKKFTVGGEGVGMLELRVRSRKKDPSSVYRPGLRPLIPQIIHEF